MNVLHLSYRGLGGGGAAVATRRLHFALRSAGIDSMILCAENPDESSNIKKFRQSRIRRRVDPLLRRISGNVGLDNLFDLSSVGIKKVKAWVDANVVSVHSYADFFSYLARPSLTESKPTVMTLHDMWNYTGHCYVSLDCDRWKSGCGKCPYPDMYRPIRRDSSHMEWRLKDWSYIRSKLTIVAPSSPW